MRFRRAERSIRSSSTPRSCESTGWSRVSTTSTRCVAALEILRTSVNRRRARRPVDLPGDRLVVRCTRPRGRDLRPDAVQVRSARLPVRAARGGPRRQNILLAATALGLAAVPLGGFYDRRTDAFLGLDGVNESPLYAIALGGEPTSLRLRLRSVPRSAPMCRRRPFVRARPAGECPRFRGLRSRSRGRLALRVALRLGCSAPAFEELVWRGLLAGLAARARAVGGAGRVVGRLCRLRTAPRSRGRGRRPPLHRRRLRRRVPRRRARRRDRSRTRSTTSRRLGGPRRARTSPGR